MAGMKNLKRLLRITVRASSLIEVITAMVIISMVFSMASIIFLNVQKTGLSKRKLEAMMILDETFTESVRTNQYVTREVSYTDEIRIYQEVRPSRLSNLLLVVVLEARDRDGKLVAEQKHLLHVAEQ